MGTVYENHFTGKKRAGKDGIENCRSSSKKYPYPHEKGLSLKNPQPSPPHSKVPDTSSRQCVNKEFQQTNPYCSLQITIKKCSVNSLGHDHVADLGGLLT